MSEQTTRLQLPYILPSQAQKHVTHNEALQRLDAVTQLVIKDELAEPPQTSDEGDCFLIASPSAGDWARKEGRLAFRQDEAWIYIVPREGWSAWFTGPGSLRLLQNGEWKNAPLPANAGFQTLGINASADETNRLAISAPATLLTHASEGGHQLKINKATSTNTASLLFQSGWSGRAEMGLAGNDQFSIKTSPDGGSWNTALSISGNGHVMMPARPLARVGRAAGNVAHAAGSVSGFTDLALQQGGFALGDIVTGSLRELRVPVTANYLVILSLSVVSSSGHGVNLCINGTPSSLGVNGTSSAANSTQSVSFMAALNENDRLSLAHTGTCQLAYGAGKTEVTLMLL